MKDTGTQEKLARYIWLGNYTDAEILGIANKYLALLEELGYRKLPEDKPPLLSAIEVTEIMKDCWTNSIPLGKTDLEKYANLSRALCFEVIEAQREADIKFYSEGK